MNLLKVMAVAALGVIAWRTWQQRSTATGARRAVVDARTGTPPHGDPLRHALLDVEDDLPAAPGAQFSRGFGGS